MFIESKVVYRNIRAGFDDNLTNHLSERSIAHAFHLNACLVVSAGDQVYLLAVPADPGVSSCSLIATSPNHAK